MSFLGSVFGGVKDAVTGVGHAVGKVASSPITQGILGATLGPGAAALAGGVGRLMAPGGNLGNAAAGAVSGGAAGLTGGVLRGALSGGAGGLLGAVKGAGSLFGGGGGGSTLGLGGGAGGGGGGNGVRPAVLALAGLQAANAASLGKKANDYSDQAFNFANDSYTSRAGLRSAGINGLANPKAPDMSGLSAIRAQNPVAARAGIGAPAPSPMAPSPALPTPLPASLAAGDVPPIHGSPSIGGLRDALAGGTKPQADTKQSAFLGTPFGPAGAGIPGQPSMGIGRVLQHVNGQSAPQGPQMAPQGPSILRSAIMRGLPQAQAPMAPVRALPFRTERDAMSLDQPMFA